MAEEALYDQIETGDPDPLGLRKKLAGTKQGIPDPLGLRSKLAPEKPIEQPQQAFQINISQPTFKSAPAQITKEFTDQKPKDELAPLKLEGKARTAHQAIQNELIGNKDVKVEMIKQRRFEQAAGNIPISKTDMPKTQAQIDIERLSPRAKPQDLPITEEDLAKEDIDIQSDRGKAVRLMEETMKKYPEKAKEIQKNLYTIDAFNSLAPDQHERVPKIEENAKQIAKGNLIYDARSNRLIQPLGLMGSAIEGWKQKSQLFADYDFLKNTENDAAIAMDLEDRRSRHDMDTPMPVPKGKLSEITQMLGATPIKPVLGGAIASLGGPQAGMAAGAIIGGREFSKLEYAATFQQVYNELRDKNVEKFEAVRQARSQAENAAEVGAVTGGAMGLVGAKLGAKPLAPIPLSSSFKQAAFNVLKSSGHELGKVGLEGLAVGGLGAAGQVYKNQLAKSIGIERPLDEGVAEQIEMGLLGTVAMAAAIKAGRGMTKPNYRNLLHGLSKMPEEQINGMLQEKVQNGEITQKAADETQARINEYKGLDLLIPENVNEEARFKIQDKIQKRQEYEQQLESQDKAYHPEIKEKIKTIDEEIVNLTKEGKQKIEKPASGLTKEQEKEATELAEEWLHEGLLPDTYEEMIKKDPIGFWKMIAQQAQNRDENWRPLSEALPEEAVRDQFGDTVVDYAKELFPAPEIKEPAISVIMPEEIKHPETITIKPQKNAQDVRGNQEQLPEIREIGERSQNISGHDIQQVSPEPPISGETQQQAGRGIETQDIGTGKKEMKQIFDLPFFEETGEAKFGEPEKVGITHAAMDDLAREFGFDTYDKFPETIPGWDFEAAKRLREDPQALNKLFDKLRRGDQPDHIDNRMMLMYMADLKAKITRNPSNELLNQFKRTRDLFNIAGREWGKAGRARQGEIPVEETLGDFLIKRHESNEGAPLTEEQIKTTEEHFKDVSESQKAFDEKVAKTVDENSKAKAEEEVKKTKSTSKKQPKKDYKAERQTIVNDIREKLRKARGETQVVAIPYAKELIAITPDVAKLVKNLIEDGIDQLPDIVKNIHGQLKEFIEDIKEQDVVDIIAGKYNEKKQTRNELAAKLFEVKKEAQLMGELEQLLQGERPRNDKKLRQYNIRIEKLKEQIKELRGTEVPDSQKLASLKARYKKEAERIEKKILDKDFAPDEKPKPIVLDKEAIDLKDRMIKARLDWESEVAREEYENRTKMQKAGDLAAQAIDAVRTFQTNPDMSFMGRQGIKYFTTHPIKGVKIFWESAKQAGSEKRYDRWFFDLQKSEAWPLIQDAGVAVSDPKELHMSKREEQWRSQLVHKIPGVGYIAKMSERAFTGAANMARVDWFMEGVNILRQQGKTWENSPEEYKAWASAVNNMTGRGGLGKLEPIARQLAIPFWSPRLIASNVNLFLNPYYYYKMPKTARIMLLKNMAQYVVTGGVFLGAAAALGAEVELDPRSSDFGKIKVGNTRYDIWGGASQYIRVLSQVLTATRKRGARMEDLKARGLISTSTNFMRSKLSPAWGFIIDAKLGTNVVGEPVEWTDAYKLAIPMLWNDIQDAQKDGGPDAAAIAGLLSFLGIGAQTYTPKIKVPTESAKKSSRPKPIKPTRPHK